MIDPAGESHDEWDAGFEATQGDASRPWLLLGTLTALLSAAGVLVLTQRLP